jgi:prophage antirepressor-like protein
VNEIQIFNNAEFGEIRTLDIDGKLYFVGNDIAKALGYAVPKDAIAMHCKGAIKHRLPTKGGKQEMKIIPEGDLYRLVAHSELPSAERFESWVFDEVLPTIRKTGQYKVEKPKAHAKNRMLKTAIKDLAGTTEAIEKMFGVKKGIAIATAMDMVGREYGIDLEPLRSLLPGEEKPGFLTATEIGEMVGGMSAQKVNKKLSELGLQEKVGGEWRLTAKGKEFGEEIPYTNHGHSGYRPMWCQEIVSEIKEA